MPSEPKRGGRGSPLFRYFAHAYEVWREHFPHARKTLTPRQRSIYLATFTTVLKCEAESGEPDEIDRACGRIEAAMICYASDPWHRKQAEKQAVPPWRRFDNFLTTVVDDWLAAARKKGLIDRHGVALHRQRSAENVVLQAEQVDQANLGAMIRDALFTDPRVRNFLACFEPTSTDRLRSNRERDRRALSWIWFGEWHAELQNDVVRVVTPIAMRMFCRRSVDVGDARFKEALAHYIKECLDGEATNKG